MLEIYGVFYGSRYDGLFPQEPLYSDKEDAIKAAKELLEEKKKENKETWTEEELEGLIFSVTHWQEIEDEENAWTNDLYTIKVKTLYVQ